DSRLLHLGNNGTRVGHDEQAADDRGSDESEYVREREGRLFRDRDQFGEILELRRLHRSAPHLGAKTRPQPETPHKHNHVRTWASARTRGGHEFLEAATAVDSRGAGLLSSAGRPTSLLAGTSISQRLVDLGRPALDDRKQAGLGVFL